MVRLLQDIHIYSKIIKSRAESHEESDFTSWAPTEPSGDLYEDCVFICLDPDICDDRGTEKIGWHDYVCDYTDWHAPIHALCETEKK